MERQCVSALPRSVVPVSDRSGDPQVPLIDVAERTGQLRPYVRPVTRLLPLAIMGVRMRVRHQSVGRAQGTRLLTVLPELYLTTVFPITWFSVSCRISPAFARRPPLGARTSNRRCCCGRCTSLRPVDLFVRHQRPDDARHLVGQSDRDQSDRTTLQDLSGPCPEGAIPLRGSVHH